MVTDNANGNGKEGMGKRLTVDLKKCVGCVICELVCSFNRHKIFNPKRSSIRVVKMDRIMLDVPMFCRQCLKPICVEACPENALKKDDTGIVKVDEEACRGCGLCVDACIVGAISLDPIAGIPNICDLCGGDPECVKWCPTKAISFGLGLIGQDKRWSTSKQITKALLREFGVPQEAYEVWYGGIRRDR